MNEPLNVQEILDNKENLLFAIAELQKEPKNDQRRLALAKTNIEQGLLWLEAALKN